jgi:serine/threonine protein kinase
MPASADSSQKLNHDAIAMARFFSGLLERYTDEVAAGYMAPEAWTRPDALGPHLDIFSLGAIAFHLFSGRSPAETLVELSEAIKDGGLQIITVLNGAPTGLQYLIQESTNPNVSRRTPTVGDFIKILNDVEEELTAPTTSETVSPSEAKKGDCLDGGFRVIERIGSGSSSVACLVQAEADGPERVLKVSRDEAHDGRIRAEGKTLGALHHHTTIVRLFEITEVSGRAALLLERAGDKTLARRLRDDGRPSLDLLARWGEELMSAVLFLEEEGVSHRDIKPDNIGIGSVGQRGSLRLILFDFSLSNAPAESI